MDYLQPKTAIVSVTNKEGIVDFSRPLVEDYNIEIISTGGTGRLLGKNNIPYTNISNYTGMPEMMDGRLKTIHPKVAGGLLAVRNNKEHMYGLKKTLGGKEIDMLVCNLYEFQESVARGDSRKEIIENMDIGGPNMVNAASKSSDDVVVVTHPTQYEIIEEEMKNNDGSVSFDTREWLACEAENMLADYFGARANWRNSQIYDELPRRLFLSLEQVKSLKPELKAKGEFLEFKYAENPGVRGIAWKTVGYDGGVFDFKQLAGPTPSWNNIRELGLTYDLIKGFQDVPTAIITKHGIVVGLGRSKEGIEEAYKLAHDTDREANLGNQTVINRRCTEKLAKMIGFDLKNKWSEDICDIIGTKDSKNWTVFTEGLIAPEYEGESLEILREKQKKKIRVFKSSSNNNFLYDMKPVRGGFLGQDVPDYTLDPRKIKGEWVTERKGDENTAIRLGYLMGVAYIVPSNAVVIGDVELDKEGKLSKLELYGVGTSTKRNRATWIAIENSGPRAEGALLASDGFFPYPDVIKKIGRYKDEEGKEQGAKIKSATVPKGGMRQEKVIGTVNECDLEMYMVDGRYFYH